MLGSTTTDEAKLRRQALADGAALFAEHDAAAVAILTGRLLDTSLSAEERRCCRLTRVEVERLLRVERQRRRRTALAVYRPGGFALAGLAALAAWFGWRRRRR